MKSAVDKDAVCMYVAYYGISLLSDVGHWALLQVMVNILGNDNNYQGEMK